MPRDPKIVSYTMSRIRGKDTSIELALRGALWAAGLRYRLHQARLPGTPDIVFPRAKVAIFCDSSFWHGRDWATKKATLRTNREYWIKKIERNMARDERVVRELRDLGWRVLRFWDLEIERSPSTCVQKVTTLLQTAPLKSPRRKKQSLLLRTRTALPG